MRIFATSRPTPKATPENLMSEMDAEIAVGRELYRDGVILEAYMDLDYSRTYMIIEVPTVEEAKARFDQYPQVRAGLIEFEFTPLIGMPAVSQVHEADGKPMPAWWPSS